MIRLLILRCSITAWKTAITVSDALKPSTWRKIAIFQATLAALLFCIYGLQPNHEPEIPPVNFAQADLPAPPMIAGPQLAQITLLSLTPATINGYFDRKNTSRVTIRYTTNGSTSASTIYSGSLTFNSVTLNSLDWESSASRFPAVVLIEAMDRRASPSATYGHGAIIIGGSKLRQNVEPVSIGSSSRAVATRYLSWGGWNPPALPDYRPKVILQMASSEQRSLLDTILRLLALFQAFSLTVGSIFASLFGWIGYQRGKADLKLKQLQIREIEARLEQMERDKQRQIEEAAKSCIIVSV